jgi:hypothetical protein
MPAAHIKSRPVYAGLTPDPNARRHLIMAEGEGALAVTDLAALATGDFFARATILYALSGSAAVNHSKHLAALGADACDVFPTTPTLLVRLSGLLATATMGTRLYASGTEGFIGEVIQLASTHGIDHRSISTEHRGSRARRVQCVHCKGITERVTTNIVRCAHCGTSLFVRDHYSRRLGAFMGVAADAEAPGELPAIEEIFR